MRLGRCSFRWGARLALAAQGASLSWLESGAAGGREPLSGATAHCQGALAGVVPGVPEGFCQGVPGR